MATPQRSLRRETLAAIAPPASAQALAKPIAVANVREVKSRTFLQVHCAAIHAPSRLRQSRLANKRRAASASMNVAAAQAITTAGRATDIDLSPNL